MRRIYPALPYAVDPTALARACVHDLVVHDDNGVDTREAWALLDRYVARLPPPAQQAVRRQKRRSRAIVWLKALRRLPFSSALERLRGYDVYPGRRHGFEDIAGAGRFAQARIAPATVPQAARVP